MSHAIAPARERERVYGLLDYGLTAIYACLSGYAAGIAIGSPKTAWMFVAIIATGTFFSYLVQQLMDDQPIIRFDGLMYVGVSLLAVIFSRDLAKLVPDQAFSGQLIVAGSLCWMLGLGSFFTWRDGTLLFQAVPGIALFGMVGVFDTFRAAPFLFFIFLMCLATLFARAHRRQMIEQAEASGFKASLDVEEADDDPHDRPKTSARLRAIYNGPWKWMAGPEWAFASAVVIVVVSLVFAPTLQFALQPLSGFVKVPPPPLTTPTRSQNPLGSGRDNSVRVGIGPLQMSDRPVLRVSLDQARFLRSRTYDTYDAGRWSQGSTAGIVASNGASLGREVQPHERALAEIRRPVQIPFRVELLNPDIASIPVPGEIENVRNLQNGDHAQKRADGTLSTLRRDEVVPPVSGMAVIASPSDKPGRAASQLPPRMLPLLDVETLPTSVKDFAIKAAEGKTTDHEKAIAIRKAIEGVALYNLQAPATPAGADPVEHFMFTSKQGYCDLFASTMTLMARSVGIPARYVTGYYPIHRKVDENGNWIINDTEAHAWAELFFEGVGWVAFDPTQGAAAVEGQGVGESNVETPWYKTAQFKRALDLAIVAIVVLGAGAFYWVRRRALAARVPSRDDVGREYARFAGAVRRATGKRRLPSDTPNDYLDSTKTALADHAESARSLNEKFVHALYSPEAISPEIIEQLRDDTDAFSRELRTNGKAGARR